MKNCGSEAIFTKQLAAVLRVLKSVLYGKQLDDSSPYAAKVNAYILSKKYGSRG